MTDPSRPRRLSVLVVDDDPTLCALLCQVVRDFGHDATSAGDGAQALATVEAARPDLVMIDYQMPVMDGVTAARQIRAIDGCADLPLVMISSCSDTRAAAMAAGVDRFMVKPVALPLLRRLLDELAATRPAVAS